MSIKQARAAATDGREPALSGREAELDALPLNHRHLLVFALCAAGLFFESLNLQLMAFIGPRVAVEWHLSPTQLGALLSAAIFGMLVGTFAFGAIADRHGRRLAFQVTVGIFSCLTALAGFSATYLQLAAARFGAGIGIGGSIPVETAVLTEFTPARWRGRILALWALALPVGGLIAPLCVTLMPVSLGWRGLLFLGGIPALLVLLVRRVVPETPGCLAARGRTDEAERATAWIAMRRPRAVPPATATLPTSAAWLSPESTLFAPGLRRITFAAWLVNFGSFFAYYGTILWMPALLSGYRGLESTAVVRFMLVLACAGIAGRLGMIFVGDRVPPSSGVVACMLAAASALALFAVQDSFAPMLLWASCAVFFLEGSFSITIPMVAEIYPSTARATGVGWAGGMGRMGTALAPIGVGVLVGTSVTAAIFLLASGALLAATAATTIVPSARSRRRGSDAI